MLIALTGATGFVGGYVLHEALAQGHAVRALTRRAQAFSHPKLEWVRGSLGERDQELCADADAVIHIAGLIKARTRADYFEANADAVRGLVEGAGDTRFVLLSSLAAREQELSDYAASKRAGEMAVAEHPDALVVRAPAVFGPGDEATEPLFRLMLKGRLPAPGGEGWRSRRLSFVYVEDLARYLVREAGGGATSVVYPATLADATWGDFAELCGEAAGRQVRLLPLPTALLTPVAAVTSVTSRVAGLGHLTLGKLREFRHPDWSVAETLPDATPMVEALQRTFESYR